VRKQLYQLRAVPGGERSADGTSTSFQRGSAWPGSFLPKRFNHAVCSGNRRFEDFKINCALTLETSPACRFARGYA
jgi:hypothetical protein